MSDDIDGENEPESPVITDLRRKAERAETAERKLALHEAGYGHLNETQRNALLGATPGDLTPEALKSAAESLGFPTQPPAPEPAAPAPSEEPSPVSADERAALERMEAATSSAEPAAAGAPLSQEDRIKAIRNEARSLEEADRLLEKEGIFLDS